MEMKPRWGMEVKRSWWKRLWYRLEAKVKCRLERHLFCYMASKPYHNGYGLVTKKCIYCEERAR